MLGIRNCKYYLQKNVSHYYSSQVKSGLRFISRVSLMSESSKANYILKIFTDNLNI